MKVITATLAAAVLLTSCGADPDESGTPAASPQASSPTTTSSPTITATPTPTPNPTPTPTPRPVQPKPVKPSSKPAAPPKAKDGTNLAACRDGDCQVLVSGRTTIRFKGGTLVITKIDKFAHFTLRGRYGSGNGQLGAGPATFGGSGLSVITGPVPRSEDPPGLTLRAPYTGGGRAVIDVHVV